jgi:hypothetical protein
VSEVAKRPFGRPLGSISYTQDVADEICHRLSQGESLSSICRTPGFPAESTVHRWCDINNDFSIEYARARRLQAEHFVDEMVDIADDSRNDFIERAKDNGEVFVIADHEHIIRSKARIETRQWIIERILSNKYGPKPQVVVNNQVNNTVSVDPIEAGQEYRKILEGE